MICFTCVGRVCRVRRKLLLREKRCEQRANRDQNILLTKSTQFCLRGENDAAHSMLHTLTFNRFVVSKYW